ncbi:MAG: imidazole glycerol phosphate synthase subunit HisH [Proteobacteria bacterium]|nr:imidazole glycerol phosphate synthase subunit HisH [Pseudomonadota bacterium]
MKTVIIDYGSGNVESVFNALLLVKNKNHEITISNNPAEIKSANSLILPGVGAFADCINGLKSVSGLAEEVRKQVITEKKPFLGICVGMQVLASIGYEDGEHKGLSFISGKVEKIIASENLKVPHMGWNELIIKEVKHPVLQNIKTGDHVYFANSYFFRCQNQNNELAHAEYGSQISAIIAKDNIFGVQFHPEKSAEVGLTLLKNFLNWRP